MTIAVAPPKGDRLDWLVQKVTEVGVDAHRAARGRAIGRAVGRRPGRAPARSPAPHRRRGRAAVATGVAARGVRAGAGGRGPGVAAVAEPGGRPRRRRRPAMAIGPEGGWSPAELARPGDQVSLGANVLRVETAAVVAATLMVAGVDERRRSACTSTSRSARRAATTARSPPGPTVRTSIGAYLDAVARRHPARGRRRDGRRRRACSSAAGRRRSSRPTAWPPCCGRSRWRPVPRSRSSATPTT